MFSIFLSVVTIGMCFIYAYNSPNYLLQISGLRFVLYSRENDGPLEMSTFSLGIWEGKFCRGN